MGPMKSVALFLLVLMLPSGCGGGAGGGLAILDGSGGGGGIGGTGLTSTGTINGFGSIFVNGVEFETGEAEVSLNGEVATENSLRLGMVVTVSGTVNDDGRTGVASTVSFDSDVAGPITAIVPGADGDSALLTVLGVAVIVERTGTVFEGVSLNTLAINDLVEVSGFFDNQQRLRATRIEKQSDFVAGISTVEVEGVVAGLSETEFMLDQFVVDFSGADLSGVNGSTLAEGMQVEVRGTLEGNRITADRVEQEDDIGGGDGEAYSVQGAISNFITPGQFTVSGVAIDASNATLEPADLVLANGITVEAAGAWRGGTLVARKIEARRGRVRIEAKVASASTSDNTITLQLFGGTITVSVDSRTLLDDDSDREDSLKVRDIVSGDFLEVEAIQTGNTLLANRINRDRQDDDVLQAPVESFTPGASITLLGVTYSTSGASFESTSNTAISEASFYSQLKLGDLVKIRDERLADGIADVVEFERNPGLEDDTEVDDNGGSASGDDLSDDGLDGGSESEPEDAEDAVTAP